MADVKISDLTAKAADLVATDTLEINESGTSKSVTGADIFGGAAAATETFTNKTFDANGTGNSLTNIDVADLANGTDGELITWSAAAAPATVAVGTATHVLTSNGVGTAPTFQAAAGGGKVLQIVTAQTDVAVSSNSTTRADTGVTVAITPSATGSKVLIVSNIHCSAGGGRAVGDIFLMRDAVDLINYSQQANADNTMGNFSFIYLDSPSTISATTYKFQQNRVDQAGLFVTSRDDSSGDAISTIMAIEIGA